MIGRTFVLAVAVGASIALTGACGTGDGDVADSAPATTVFSVSSVRDDHAVRVGVLAIRSAVAANGQYGPIVDYLEDELQRPFELVPLAQDELFEAVADGEIDFVLSNPLSSVQVQRLYDTEFLATIDRVGTGPEFGGLIIVRADSDMETLDDLRGADVTCVAFETAAAGCNFQVMHLREAGIDTSEFARFTETPSQDNIVLAVLTGDVDAGFVRTGQLERMVAEGTLASLDDVRILDRHEGDYPYPHTTPLYPEWPVAALAETDGDVAAAVADALLTIEAGHPALANANAAGFVAPPDYGPLDRLVVELELRSWDAAD
ncbi:phosphate/phosphite/phosphonate ABC transporter substrate-binding protein [Ilumatobacter fluminis]|nr:phosphate/phosphite/phosphonate ABC transporter substrate-binding protein [Ilumatobacter fluminis]